MLEIQTLERFLQMESLQSLEPRDFWKRRRRGRSSMKKIWKSSRNCKTCTSMNMCQSGSLQRDSSSATHISTESWDLQGPSLLWLTLYLIRERSTRRSTIEPEITLMTIWDQLLLRSKELNWDSPSRKMSSSTWVRLWLTDIWSLNWVSLTRKWSRSMMLTISSKLNSSDNLLQHITLSTWLRARSSSTLMKVFSTKQMRDSMVGASQVSEIWSLLCRDSDLWVW